MSLHLHAHSEYSILDGAATVAENADRCVEIGSPCCSLTDHGTVAGHLELDKECRKRGLKPVFGMEAYHGVQEKKPKGQTRDQAHLVLFAMTDEGLKNLWRLSDWAARDERFHHVERISWDALERFSEGLGATSSCMGGLVPQGLLKDDLEPLNRYLSIFRDNFWIELHTYPGEEHERLNERLVEIGRERGLPFIFATDSHYARPEQYEMYDMYIAKQHGDSIYASREQRKIWHPPGMYLQSDDEIRESLSYLPEGVVDEAIKNSDELAEKVDAHLPDVNRHLPSFIVRDCPWKDQFDFSYGDDSEALLYELVEKGLKKRYGDPIPAHVRERAQMELEAFYEAQIHHYFLLGWDTVQFCKANGIDMGPGRGSSAGSICAFALEITDVDPLPYDLIFERFWNRGRAKGFPDIDSDFPRRDRDRIKKYLAERWGEDRVRSIGNIERMKPLAVIEKTYKSCGITDAEMKQLKKIVERVPDLDIHGPESIGWSEDTWPGKTIYVMHPSPRYEHDTGEKIIEWVEKQPEHRQRFILRWLKLIDFLCGRIGGKGVHASGVIVSDEDLPTLTPCRWARDPQIPVTQFPMDEVESLMLVKYDVLGLRTLDTLAEWKALVEEQGVSDFSWSQLEWKDHPIELWQQLDGGYSAGIFQVDSVANQWARQYCKRLKPRSVADLSLLVAIDRPGPIRSGAPDSLLRRRHGEEPVTYDDTADPKDRQNGWLLAEILEPTYGWFIYQEQIIRFFEAIGYSKFDADAIRKILGKKKPEEMTAVGLGRGEWEGKGYREMAMQAGLQHDPIQTIWERLEGFASYSFNKSHSVAYGTLSFRTLFAKYNAPVEFYLACVRTVDQNKKAILVPRYMNEARRMGIDIRPPDILRSRADISLIDSDIYYGFKNIKNVASSADFIVNLRDAYDVETPDKLREALAQWDKDTHVTERRREAKAAGKALPPTGKQHLNAKKITSLENAGAFDNYVNVPISLSEKQAHEKDLLGVILTDTSVEAYANNWDALEECDSYDMVEDSEWEGEDLHFNVPGIINEIIEVRSRKTNKPMGIVKIEYDGNELEFVVRPDLWTSYNWLWKERTPGIFALKRYEGGISFEKGQKLT